jgi:chromosome segregation ATPase
MEVVETDLYPVATKIKQVIELILRAHKSELEQMGQELEHTRKERDNLLGLWGGFMISLSREIYQEDITLERVIADPLILNGVCERFRALNDELTELSQQIAGYQENMSYLCTKLSVGTFPEALAAIDRTEGLKPRIRKLLKFRRRFRTEIAEKEENFRKVLKRQKKRLRASETERNKLAGDLASCQSEVARLKQGLDNLSQTHRRSCDELSESVSRLMEDRRLEKESFDVRDHDSKIFIMDLQRKLEESSKKLDEVIESKKKAKEVNSGKIARLKKQFIEAEREFGEKLNRETNIIQGRCDRALDQLKERNTTLQKMFQEATAALQECESRAGDLSASNAQLKREKTEALAVCEVRCEQWKKKQEELEAKVKNSERMATLSAKRQMEIAEEKVARERRELLTTIQTILRRYVDTNREMNSSYIREVLGKVSEDLTSLERQDSSLRRLLGIGVNQSLEDAVAKLLLSVYHP